MRAFRLMTCGVFAGMLAMGCGPGVMREIAEEWGEGEEEAVEPAPEVTPVAEETPAATPTPPEARATPAAQEPEVEAGGRVLQRRLTHRDGTTALLEVAEPRLLRLETTELTLTCDGRLCLAVFPDMRAYAILDSPGTYTMESLAELSPVLEPMFVPHLGVRIPARGEDLPSGWTATGEAVDRARFSTQPPRFHRDITSQVARPVGEYAAMRLIGEPAPYFEVRGLDGTTMSLADFEGQAMLVDFWATWCPPCLESMPKLDALDRRYGAAGLVVLGMNMDEGPNALRAARQFVAGHGFGFRQAEGGAAAADFRVEVLPTLFLLDREHVIRNVYVGLPPDERSLRGEVELLMR
jgi:cytochrome c biogenesis protein CcmG, thiol:disulfide interchange protein DsbE